MAKQRRRYTRFSRRSTIRRRPKFTLPLAIVAGFASPIGRTISATRSGGIMGGLAEFTNDMMGFNPFGNPIRFNPTNLRYGLLPVLAGFLLHKVAGTIGLNRQLARAGIPIIRI